MTEWLCRPEEQCSKDSFPHVSEVSFNLSDLMGIVLEIKLSTLRGRCKSWKTKSHPACVVSASVEVARFQRIKFMLRGGEYKVGRILFQS